MVGAAPVMLARALPEGKPTERPFGLSRQRCQPPGRRRCSREAAALRVRCVTWETPQVLSTAVTVFAHQGGWDEILMVLTPIAVFALLLKLANSRANKARDAAAARDRAAAGAEPADEASPDRDG